MNWKSNKTNRINKRKVKQKKRNENIQWTIKLGSCKGSMNY